MSAKRSSLVFYFIYFLFQEDAPGFLSQKNVARFPLGLHRWCQLLHHVVHRLYSIKQILPVRTVGIESELAWGWGLVLTDEERPAHVRRDEFAEIPVHQSCSTGQHRGWHAPRDTKHRDWWWPEREGHRRGCDRYAWAAGLRHGYVTATPHQLHGLATQA